MRAWKTASVLSILSGLSAKAGVRIRSGATGTNRTSCPDTRLSVDLSRAAACLRGMINPDRLRSIRNVRLRFFGTGRTMGGHAAGNRRKPPVWPALLACTGVLAAGVLAHGSSQDASSRAARAAPAPMASHGGIRPVSAKVDLAQAQCPATTLTRQFRP